MSTEKDTVNLESGDVEIVIPDSKKDAIDAAIKDVQEAFEAVLAAMPKAEP